ncbi:MAG: hypothetical protein L6R42_010447 [Xanthoria sp. 1 TBL-2021]|nr:MAG: hypothetical protein L6R42_010447 [Xanthoria sp. 1 TBL-2021]
MLLFASFLHPTQSTPLQRPATPSHSYTISITPYNTLTVPNLDLISFLRTPQPLSTRGASETITGGIAAARAHGPDARVPPQGFRTTLRGVRLYI